MSKPQSLLIKYPAHKPPLNFLPVPEQTAVTTFSDKSRLSQWLFDSQQQFVTSQTALYQSYLNLQSNIAALYAQTLATLPEQATTTAMTTPEIATPTMTAPPATPLAPPLFSRQDLIELSSGKISKYFGPLFLQQDNYKRQVRLPEPPLLLVDRVLKISGEAGSLGNGSIWTETDVVANAWYLQAGRMSAGITVESGQSDLLLISWLGIDFYNQGQRIYRLLGCELTFFDELPKPGDTLCFDIHVDAYAMQGDTRLFFFHYDGRINGKVRLQVRHGQAGFFTDAELANSQGVLWDPIHAKYQSEPRLVTPPLLSSNKTLNKQQLQALSQGDIVACFGPAFYMTQTHSRTPTIGSDQLLFLDEVTHFEIHGGPQQRGYMRGIQWIQTDDWFFAGHFKNDPCMPGTLMVDAGLQLMACYLIGCGFSLDKDGWRFEPATQEKYTLQCRGQVTPQSKQVVYEIFVDELFDQPYPILYAHLLGSVDGLKAFYTRIALRLVPDWPLSSKLELLANHIEQKPVATLNGFAFDYASLLAAAWGEPVQAFGALLENHPKHRRAVRLPGPPYHFVSRVLTINATAKQADIGASVTVEYDIPENAWYFAATQQTIMPWCVLMEITLQPCGWLTVFTGGTLRTDEDLYFRNLEGTAQIQQLITAQFKSLSTRVTLTKHALLGDAAILSFNVASFDPQGEIVYVMDTVFGFFPQKAFANQAGLTTTEQQRELLTKSCDFWVDLAPKPAEYFNEKISLPAPPLLMLNRITGWWENISPGILCQLRAEKTVKPTDWYFKAHFYQDPVQPGSLGVDALYQLLQFYMLQKKLHTHCINPIFAPVLAQEIKWKYRGQVTPDNQCVTLLLDVIEQGQNNAAPYAIANGTLWVDGKCIYSVEKLHLQIIERL